MRSPRARNVQLLRNHCHVLPLTERPLQSGLGRPSTLCFGQCWPRGRHILHIAPRPNAAHLRPSEARSRPPKSGLIIWTLAAGARSLQSGVWRATIIIITIICSFVFAARKKPSPKPRPDFSKALERPPSGFALSTDLSSIALDGPLLVLRGPAR